MNYTVRFTPGARKDLRAIFDSICESDSSETAGYAVAQIVEAGLALSKLSTGGAYPPELVDLGIRANRQIFFQPYCILYTLRGSSVLVAIIADGRRDMQSLLARRLHEN